MNRPIFLTLICYMYTCFLCRLGQTQSCTNCGGDGSCNMNSVCNNGCLPGFYSLACAQSCGKCGGNGSCNRLSRFCDESSCLPRYFGPLCIQLCPLNCGGDGSCDFQTANCLQGCKSRFSGTRCELSVACPSSTCRDPCQAINGGICTSGCRSGYFGEICNRVCNCQNNGACVQDTGVCESISQTTSVTVPTTVSDINDNKNDNTALLIGLSVSLVLVLILLVIVILLLVGYKKRKRSEFHVYEGPVFPPSEGAIVVYDSLDLPPENEYIEIRSDSIDRFKINKINE
uniref:Uncharacterized protein n=2 Tax=Magallana gigas TaxID=29159 RepID=A0A8W8IXC1_MAGGI|nr:platelet endothelial aggregation receptor 1 isoform X2 [Crassostrea gigas]XP_034312416.1 platelet endothelial aggregation receptor 1-like isoform X1 [Crassostrea gigas]